MIRIGIVDDEKQERDQLKQALARFGAENGTELNVFHRFCAVTRSQPFLFLWHCILQNPAYSRYAFSAVSV